MNTVLATTFLALFVVLSSHGSATEPTIETFLTSEVQWEPLNPARGDKSPQAGTLWGDRQGTGPTGFLVKFTQGFSSPPHIHNVSYRGVVIRGLIHNDDPDAAEMWMPPGSFWTQPKGEAHITAAKGKINMAYIEIEDGPYLVRPIDQVFDSGERPVNVDPSNIVWLDASDTTWIDSSEDSGSAKGPEIAFLWGNPQGHSLSGSFVKLPAGFRGKIQSSGSTFRAVVIQGQPQYQIPGEDVAKGMKPGSYLGSRGESTYPLFSEAECVLYVRSEGQFTVRMNSVAMNSVALNSADLN